MDTWKIEKEARGAGYKNICGVDEAGRGPIAGPVYAAAVILPFGLLIPGLDDSKRLTARKRDELYDVILERALAFQVSLCDESEILRFNILGAAMLAMRRAVEALDIRPGLAIIDGNRSPGLGVPERLVVGGDALSANVAAASVLAKVERDRYMVKLAEIYPEYMFEKHKGYPTALHYEMLAKYGPCPAHRTGFRLGLKP